ncbi:MAG: ABC transporter ATP-binding protein [Firmicutes bacterium]|nr:ABC transporter ATP-binding protein [Bacillota bacterium]MBQ6684790.1 ABC transporter ATP-binding protein [Bacillota bacterium]
MSDYKVEVKDLCKNFGSLEVLKNCNFNIKRGEFVCVVGPTGCGKTTFLNTLTCLIPPTSGQILIDGEPADPKKHNLSFVFQEPSAMPWLTVEDNIAFGMKLKGWDKAKIKEQTDKIIDLMGLNKSRKQYPHELSVSTEQKVVIGRAFAMEPDLLLMDEPYGQMDIKTRFYLEDEVIRLWKELGSTVLFITHNVEEACYLADRVLILSNKPASVKEDLSLTMERPRDIASPEFIEKRVHVENAIKWW